MPTGLFDNDSKAAYADFGELPDDYPFNEFVPINQAFTRKGFVTSQAGKSQRKFYVDLSIGECDCGKGHAYSWDNTNSRWYATSYCSHKLQMLCSIIEAASDDRKASLTQAYIKAVATRYNQWEVVSAFHKELRRGDFQKAWFFGLIVGAKRGMKGVFKYLLNILYEETRDHVMGMWLIEINSNPAKHTLDNLSKAIRWFCASAKKWMLPERFTIYEAEMRGYAQLVQEHGVEVAKGGDIIDAKFKAVLLDDMKRGFSVSDRVRMQHGLKGLQKLEHGGDLDAHRYWLYEQLYDYADTMFDAEHSCWEIVRLINARHAAGFGIGYHELNALADSIAGESGSAGCTSPATRKRLLAAPTAPVPLAIWPPIPLYASDNHTYKGKALLRKFPEEATPGAKQDHIDLRLCGAYIGVVWRYLAWRQHDTLNVPWHEVKWPQWMSNTVLKLWY